MPKVLWPLFLFPSMIIFSLLKQVQGCFAKFVAFSGIYLHNICSTTYTVTSSNGHTSHICLSLAGGGYCRKPPRYSRVAPKEARPGQWLSNSHAVCNLWVLWPSMTIYPTRKTKSNTRRVSIQNITVAVYIVKNIVCN